MAKITYHTHDNKTHTIDVQNGLTVMEGAVQNDIPEYHSAQLLPLQSNRFEHRSYAFYYRACDK